MAKQTVNNGDSGLSARTKINANFTEVYTSIDGLTIGSDVQAYDADLTAIAGLTSAADRLPYYTGSGTASLATFTSFARTILDDADAATVRTTLGLAIGTNVQAYDANLPTWPAGVDATEVGYLNGVTSAIQTQLDALHLPDVGAQTGTTYTFALTDGNDVRTFSNAAAITVTVPPNSSVAFPIGTFIEIHQIGAGTVTLAAGAGVTINSRGGLLDLAGQYAVAGLRKMATDTWSLTGDIA